MSVNTSGLREAARQLPADAYADGMNGALPTMLRVAKTLDVCGEARAKPTDTLTNGENAFVIRNSPTLVAYRSAADLFGKGVTLAITVMAARALDPQEFGVLMLAMTTGWLLGVASDAGLPLYLARTAAREGAETPSLRLVLRQRLAFAVPALAVGAVVAALLAADWWIAFAVIVLAQIASTTLETITHYFRGIGRSDLESSLLLGARAGVALLTLGVLAWRPSLLGVALGLAAPAVTAAITAGFLARRMNRGRVVAEAALDARDYLPIGLGVLLSAIYFRCDVYFVEAWHGLDTAGYYNAAFRLVEGLRILPAAVLAVQFPALCRAADLRPLRELGVRLGGAGLAAAALLMLAAPAVLPFVYGPRFAEATTALQILALALPLFFLNYALTHQVIAWDGQRAYLRIAAAALAANLIANAVLIPGGGMNGAALATLLTEIVVAGGCALALTARRRAPRLSQAEV